MLLKKTHWALFLSGAQKNRGVRWNAQNTGEIVPQINKPEPITEPMHIIMVLAGKLDH